MLLYFNTQMSTAMRVLKLSFGCAETKPIGECKCQQVPNSVMTLVREMAAVENNFKLPNHDEIQNILSLSEKAIPLQKENIISDSFTQNYLHPILFYLNLYLFLGIDPGENFTVGLHKFIPDYQFFNNDPIDRVYSLDELLHQKIEFKNFLVSHFENAKRLLKDEPSLIKQLATHKAQKEHEEARLSRSLSYPTRLSFSMDTQRLAKKELEEKLEMKKIMYIRILTTFVENLQKYIHERQEEHTILQSIKETVGWLISKENKIFIAIAIQEILKKMGTEPFLPPITPIIPLTVKNHLDHHFHEMLRNAIPPDIQTFFSMNNIGKLITYVHLKTAAKQENPGIEKFSDPKIKDYIEKNFQKIIQYLPISTSDIFNIENIEKLMSDGSFKEVIVEGNNMLSKIADPSHKNSTASSSNGISHTTINPFRR